MVFIFNKRISGGSLFHFAHFITDTLFPEVIYFRNIDISFNSVYRVKDIHQTIGNFSSIYEDVLQIKNIELPINEIETIGLQKTLLDNKEKILNKENFDYFKNFVFNRYNTQLDKSFPKVILVKRGNRIQLIDDPELQSINTNITTGKERREIINVDSLETFLKNKYESEFESLIFEHIPFELQVKYFYNAELVICAHGAVMSNLFFSRENSTIIEVTFETDGWYFFDKMTNINNIRHIKCKNDYYSIINTINNL